MRRIGILIFLFGSSIACYSQKQSITLKIIERNEVESDSYIHNTLKSRFEEKFKKPFIVLINKNIIEVASDKIDSTAIEDLLGNATLKVYETFPGTDLSDKLKV